MIIIEVLEDYSCVHYNFSLANNNYCMQCVSTSRDDSAQPASYYMAMRRSAR